MFVPDDLQGFTVDRGFVYFFFVGNLLYIEARHEVEILDDVGGMLLKLCGPLLTCCGWVRREVWGGLRGRDD